MTTEEKFLSPVILLMPKLTHVRRPVEFFLENWFFQKKILSFPADLQGLNDPVLGFNYSRDFHTYDTRTGINFFFISLLAKTSNYRSSFRCNWAKVWNTLPPNIRQETSLPKFKKKLKLHCPG